VSGIQKIWRKQVFVTFNIIIPQDVWAWDRTCRVYLRLGPDWYKDIGDFKECRQFGDDRLWMVCTLKFDSDKIYGRWIQYKYVITSPTRKKNDEIFECFHKNYANRCLFIPDNFFFSEGNFLVYDGMVVPEKSVATLLTDYLRNLIPMMKANPFEAQNESFFLFFEYYKSILMNTDLSLTSGNDFMTILNSISTIFHQIRYQTIFYQNAKDVNYLINTSLPMVFKRSLFEIALHIKTTTCEQETNDGGKIPTVLLILILMLDTSQLIKKDTIILQVDECSMLLSMLCFDPKIICDLMSSLPANYIQNIVEKLVFSVNYILASHTSLEWFYAVALIHIFSKKIKPFANPPVVANELTWTDNTVIQLQLVKCVSASSIAGQLCYLEPLAELDHLIWQYLVYICPKEEFHELVPFIPAYLSVAWLLELVRPAGKHCPGLTYVTIW
jgi:hypothetical protein